MSSKSTQVPAEDLTLCPDAKINEAVIEYEDWLQTSISELKGPLMTMIRPRSRIQKQLIEDITLATEQLHIAKRGEWSRQLAVIPSQVPLPSSVIDNQCSIVDGGQSPFSAPFNDRGAKPPSRKIPLHREYIGPYCALLLPRTCYLLPCHEYLHCAL